MIKNPEFRIQRRVGTRSGIGLCRFAWLLTVAAVAGLGFAAPGWAIPSPDLLINLSASAAQVMGLVSVLIGGFAYSAGRKREFNAQRRRLRRWVFGGAMLCLFVSIGINIYQYTRALDEQNQRFRTNLLRSSVEDGRGVGDSSLKTLSFSEQLQHPLGIQTETLEAWLRGGRALNLIDVREPEEVERGGIEGAWHIRYPDLRQHPRGLAQAGAATVLLCYSGNRSSELCEAFTREGHSCSFLVGGYEKWIAEGRPLAMAGADAPGALRELPAFPHKTTLLSTARVTDLIDEQDAIFVDVRYPGDFASGHLPAAFNIPVRKLPSAELEAQIRGLPRRPVIAPCYDKRSCFYAQILGLRLHRAGHDYRGRYTVPHEYVPVAADRAHVAAWKSARQGRSILALVGAPLHGALQRLGAASGHLAVAILLVVVGLRAVFLPFSLKAERDQLCQRMLAPQVKAIKARLGEDTPRVSRSIMGLYRKNGLTPVRNMLASLAQIALFLILFMVVDEVADTSTQGLLWMPTLAQPDPTGIVPFTVALLLFAYVGLTASRRTWPFMLLYLGLGTGVAMLAMELNAGVNLYLGFSVLLIFAQSALARYRFRRERQAAAEAARASVFSPPGDEDPGVVALRDAHRVRGAGNKAIRLAQLMSVGLPVPDGFVITDKVLARSPAGAGGGVVLEAGEQARVEGLWSELGAQQVAVRSSGLHEDGADQSYAGVFESRLNVSWEQLAASLEAVRDSLHSRRAGAYGGKRDEPGGVLVQAMVDAQYAGVLFTEHPASAGAMLVELVAGLGEALVSGNATPKSYRFGRLSGALLDTEGPALDLGPLLELGRRVEALYGRAQDIEWAYCGGRFVLLQARDITTSVRERNLFERERHRLLGLAEGAAGEEVVFVQNELSELLPRPTPLSFSLMQRLWAGGGSTDLACRSLGIPYEVDEEAAPYVVSVFGSLYVNHREGKRRSGQGPGALAAFRLARSAEAIEGRFRDQFLPRFLRKMRIHEVIDLSQLTQRELLSLFEEWTDVFVQQTYVQAEIINVAADFYWKTARRRLQRAGLDPAEHLSGIDASIVHQAMSLLPEIRQGNRGADDFIHLFGHRAPHDYELSQPRYRENDTLVEDLIARASPAGGPQAACEQVRVNQVLALNLKRAKRFQVLKEEAKHNCLRQLANLRRLALEIGHRLHLGDGIFQLRLDEIRRLGEAGFLARVRSLIAQRRRETRAWAAVGLPAQLTLAQLEALDPANAQATLKHGAVSLRGTRVAGDGEVIGPVQVISDPREIDSFREGHILVARFTDPTWTPLFTKAKGLVTEVGGWLSHAAIVAREYNLTTIVGVADSSRRLADGELVRLTSDGRVEKVRNRRRHGRIRACSSLIIAHSGIESTAVLSDLSKSGARISLDAPLKAGDEVVVFLSDVGGELHAKVVRKTAAGSYGVAFSDLLDELPSKDAPSDHVA